MTPLRRLLARLAGALYRAYAATFRIRLILPDGTLIPKASGVSEGQIFALSERDTLALAAFAAERGFAALVADGRDGDWAAEMLVALGCRVVRGSSRRGGTEALVALLQEATTTSTPIGIVVDGPLGPVGVARPGAVMCAVKSGRPLRALGIAARWTLRFPRTWSGIYLPLPFARIIVSYDLPLPIGGHGDVTQLTRDLTDRLAATRRQAEAALRSLATSRRIGARVRSMALLARDAAVAAIVVPVLAPVWLLPWRAALVCGRWYGYIACAAWPYGRRVGMINLRRAYGGALSKRAARAAVWQVFGSLGQAVAEGVQFGRRYKGAVPLFRRDHEKKGYGPFSWRDLYECEDPALERRILDDPRPKILVTGHLGSWELAGGLAALRTGRAGAVIARRIDNPFLDALWRRLRVRHAAEWIEKHGAAHEALARLRRGQSIIMLLDENGGPRGVFVPFFGTPASTRKTPAVLSLATGAPIVVGACVRRPGRPFLFRLALLEPDRQLDADRAIVDLTARIVSTYEVWIRDAPLQWRWIHWRWKARPDGSEERYGRAELARAFASADLAATGATERLLAQSEVEGP